MRDPERIRPFLNLLGDLWEQHPDMRFGQLVLNLIDKEDELMYYREEEYWIKQICRKEQEWES